MTVVTDELITAGAILAGPQLDEESYEDWQARVSRQAIELFTLTGERSRVRKALEQVAAAKKPFLAVITQVKKEKSSARALVGLQTKPTQKNPEGIERARSERTDRSDGMLMAKQLVALKGHLVRLWIEVEAYDGGSVRVIRHLQDLGVARDDVFDDKD